MARWGAGDAPGGGGGRGLFVPVNGPFARGLAGGVGGVGGNGARTDDGVVTFLTLSI